MTIESHIRAGGREAEKLMTSAVTITAPGGSPVLDEETGEYITPTVTIYEGKGRIRLQSLSVQNVDAQGQMLAVQDLILSLPVAGTGNVEPDHTLTITSNPLDPALEGVSYRIAGTSAQTHATARRFTIERTS